MVFNNNLLLGAAGQSGAFDTTLIERSAWFDGVADWMTVSYGVNESSVRFIVGGWLRRLSFTYVDPHFIRTSQNGYPNSIFFTSADKLTIRVNNQSWTTTQVFRDVDWYHILVSIDTTATGETCHLYVNGERVTSFTSSVAITDATGWFNTTYAIDIGGRTGGSFANMTAAQLFGLPQVSIQNSDYTVADFLDTYTFGTNGSQYIPKADATIAALATAVGGNAFCLTTAIGDGTDASGNGNNFTVHSMSDAANGSADTPSLVYPVLSFIDNDGNVNGGGNFFEGNKGWQGTSAGYSGPISTQWLNPASDTKGFYVEAKLYNATNINTNTVGLLNESFDRNPNQYLGSTAGSWGIDGYARFYAEAISIFDSTNLTTASVVQFYFEPSEGKLWIGIDDSYWNGSSLTTFSAASPSVSGLPTDQLYAFGIRGGNSGGWYMYFEEQDWTYSPPASGVPINSANLGTPSFQGADYFTVTLAQEANIEADVASAVADWSSNVTLYKNLAAAESWIHRFSSDASNEYLTGDNASPTYQSTSTLTGTNNWVAFSFRTENQAYQETGISHTNGAVTTVTHNLGNADAMILLYNRSGTGNIFIYAPQLTAGKLVKLNTNAPEAVDTSIQNVLANSFDIGSTQATGTYDVFILLNGDVFGVTSYIGNGATNGSFLPLSFKPQFTYIRHINVTNDGPFFDTTRDDTGNVTNDALFINLNDVEYPDISSYNQDFLSGGWKARITNVSFNSSSVKYFVLAVADIAGGGDLPPIYGR